RPSIRESSIWIGSSRFIATPGAAAKAVVLNEMAEAVVAFHVFDCTILDFTSVDRWGRVLRYPPPAGRQANGRRFHAALALGDAGAPRRVFPGRTPAGD